MAETSIYKFFLPEPTDSMADVKKNLTDSFKKIEKAASTPNEPTLPTYSSSYRVGDRIYLSDSNYQSLFLLVTRSSIWGNVWRPIQASMAPWTNIPASAIVNSDYEAHPTYTPQFSLCSKGFIYWRGAIRKKTGTLPNDTSVNILGDLPKGIRHHTRGMFTVALDPAPQTGTGLSAYRGGRWYIQNLGTVNNTFRFHSAEFSTMFFLDGIDYAIGEGFYYGA